MTVGTLTTHFGRMALCACALALAACSASNAADMAPAIENATVPAETLDFQNINPAIAMAHAYGDRAATAHGSFGTFPANFVTPVHTHTGAYRAVVIEGTMTNPFEGEANPPKMGPGSCWSVAAGSVSTLQVRTGARSRSITCTPGRAAP